MFNLSERSLNNLKGVNERLVKVVHRAIEITKIDFAVIEGVRTPEKQLQYFNEGKSQVAVGGTHVEGKAVDLMAFHDGKGSWDLTYYDDIADAMKQASSEYGIAIRWGAAWNVPDIRMWSGTMQDALNHYVATRRKEGRQPFIDAPHFELL